MNPPKAAITRLSRWPEDDAYQACAFRSPFYGMMSAMAILRQQRAEILFVTPHAIEEREVRSGPVNTSHAETPAPTHGVLSGEMVYPFTYYVFGTWMPKNQGAEKRMMWFLNGHLEGLAIQQILKEAIGGIPCLKTPLPDN